MVINCFRYFGMKDLESVNRLTIKEYRLMLKAYELRKLDEEHMIHLQAWANVRAKATKKVGKAFKSVYKNFKQFFDFEKRENEILGKVFEPSSLSQRISEWEKMKNDR